MISKLNKTIIGNNPDLFSGEISPAYSLSYYSPVPEPEKITCKEDIFVRIPMVHTVVESEAFDILSTPYSPVIELGNRYLGTDEILVNVDIMIEGKNRVPPPPAEKLFEYSIGLGNTNTMLITDIVASGTSMQITTQNPHLLSLSDYVIITGTTDKTCDASGLVTSITSPTIFEISSSLVETDNKGIMTKNINYVGQITYHGFFQQISKHYLIRLQENDFIYPLIMSTTSGDDFALSYVQIVITKV